MIDWRVMLITKLKIKLNCFLTILCSISIVLLGCQFNSLKKSEEFLDSGMPQEAVEKLEAFIESSPQNPEARMLLGKAYNEIGRYNDAIGQFQKASQLYTAQPEKRMNARLESARTYLIFGDRKTAFRILNIVQKGTVRFQNFTKNHRTGRR